MNIYDAFMYPIEKRILEEIRRDIIPSASGDVLEIGFGTGVNFQYYNSGLIKNISAVDIESAAPANIITKLPVKFYEGRAENLPFEDESFDTVVETLVFCSVENLNIAISEVVRVLRPGGLFIFIDHVKPENKSLASLFNTVNIVWPKIAGGCNLVREPHKLIEASGIVIEKSGKSGFDIFRWGIGRKAS